MIAPGSAYLVTPPGSGSTYAYTLPAAPDDGSYVLLVCLNWDESENNFVTAWAQTGLTVIGSAPVYRFHPGSPNPFHDRMTAEFWLASVGASASASGTITAQSAIGVATFPLIPLLIPLTSDTPLSFLIGSGAGSATNAGGSTPASPSLTPTSGRSSLMVLTWYDGENNNCNFDDVGGFTALVADGHSYSVVVRSEASPSGSYGTTWDVPGGGYMASAGIVLEETAGAPATNFRAQSAARFHYANPTPRP